MTGKTNSDTATRRHWLFKTEPETYSFSRLIADRKTHWNGVRNFQARNFLKQAAPGDLALIYHSGDEKAVVGIAQVVREAYPDIDPETPGDWVQIDIQAIQPLRRPIGLREIKATASLATLPLIKQSRLSCMPVSPLHFETILKLSARAATPTKPPAAKAPSSARKPASKKKKS